MGLFREIKQSVAGHGHGCGCGACVEQYHTSASSLDRILLGRLCAALVLFITACFFGSIPWLRTLLSIASILTAGYDRVIRAVSGCIRERTVDEELLMLVAMIAALAIGRVLEAAVSMLLLQIGALLQGYLRERVRRGQDALAGAPGLDTISDDKTHAEEFLSYFARFYTPIIMGIALVMAVLLPIILKTTVREGVYRALILLVIACPCAFTVSVPLAYLSGIGAAARQGILIGSVRAEDLLCHVGTVVFDKKTSLEGDGLRVLSVKSDRMDAEVLLRIAAHACAYSDDEMARSIKAAYQDTIYIELIQSFVLDPGRGITVEVDGVSIILGSEEFVREHGVDPGLDAVPELSVYLAIDGKYAGRILLGSTAREDAASAVSTLSWEKGRSVVMLSDDVPAATEKFARSIGVGQYYADCTPEKKAQIASDLRERMPRKEMLLFAGDASSDAACFAEADIGFSLSEPGDAASLPDICAAGNGPGAVVRAIEGAKHTKTIVTQNIIGALAFKVIVLLLDMLGVCPLWLAVFADAGVTLAASINCLRALIPPEQGSEAQ